MPYLEPRLKQGEAAEREAKLMKHDDMHARNMHQ
jgi:hypothetical protein